LAQIVVAALLAEGHLLIEDVPGVGKTTLAKALARAIDCQVGRVQFTPDLLPSDLTGGSIYRSNTSEFEFRPGPIFNNIIIADEINRASPKTQSALLEAMEESQATVEGTSHNLPRPFLVVATQNPVELEGTYPLPEAQRDRFLARLEIGYPTPAAEMELLDRPPNTLDQVVSVSTAAELTEFAQQVAQVKATDAAKEYVLALVTGTRNHRDVRLGASPRASIALLRMAKAIAAMEGRDYVIPDDVQLIAVPVLAHRLILQAEARLSGRSGQQIITEIVRTTPVSRGSGRNPVAIGRVASAGTSKRAVVSPPPPSDSRAESGTKTRGSGRLVRSTKKER
jgi:MoxR-like ATPase